MNISSVGGRSGMSGNGISAEVLSGESENMSSCPATLRFCRSATSCNTLSYTASICARFAPVQSKAPACMRFSTARRLTSVSLMRSQKSCSDANGPFSRSCSTARISARPTFLIADSPKRMPPGSTVNTSRERLMSGGRRDILKSLHSLTYSAIFSELSSTEVSRAAMYSRV